MSCLINGQIASKKKLRQKGMKTEIGTTGRERPDIKIRWIDSQ